MSVPADAHLEELVRDALGHGVRSVTTRPCRYATTHAITDVEVVLADGSQRTLLYKDLGIARRLPEAKGFRPAVLDDPGREVQVYRSLLAGGAFGSAVCLASEADDEAEAWWLLLERVPGVELWQIGEHDRWCGVAAWAAVLHRSPVPADDALLGRLVAYDRAFFELWPVRARRFAERWEPDRRRRLAGVLEGYGHVLDALVEQPRCLVHGDLYPSNVLLDRATGRIAAVDWELAGTGTAMLDLSALVGGDWSHAERNALVGAYHDALPAGARPPLEELAVDLMRCELHRCLQWLGWAPGWRAPSEHHHDWLGRAESLTERLVS